MRIVGKTDIGMVRSTNQDAFKIVALGTGAGLALVCDGMGGAKGGDTASSLAKKIITETVCAKYQEFLGAEAAENILNEAIVNANQAIYQLASENPELSGMGTTVVLVLLHQNHAYIAHVGDSRLYCYRNGQLIQLTKDHSLVQEMLDSGQITESEARDHPNKNIITRSVGVRQWVEIDQSVLELMPEDRLLLCSDGLSNLCSDEEMAEVLETQPIDQGAETLIRMANQDGGHDNITVVIVEC